MKFSRKLAIAAIPAAMALSAPDESKSKLLLMSQEGWEVSFDGAANAFVMHQSSDASTVAAAGNSSGGGDGANGVTTFETNGAVMGAGTDSTGVVTGLLPNVWGMTLKAPTNNGLDMQARLGLYTHMNGGNNALGNGQINLRETNFSVSGSFGTILVGRSLGIYSSSGILNDMLLFGVGAAATADNSNTTLGRIGLGYLYTDFQPQISWTTPGFGPIGFKVGLFDPNDVISVNSAADATENVTPRVEAQATFATEVSGVAANFWVEGSYQNTEFTAAAASTCNAIPTTGAQAGSPVNSNCDDVDSAGVAAGTKLSIGNFSIVASGWYGSGMGMRGQHSEGALDAVGKPFQSYGGYLQGTADLGGGTNVGYSYGGNYKLQTGNEISSTAVAEVNFNDMHSVMVWHNVNDSFRLIAEGGYVRQAFHMGGANEDTFGGVGAFFFW
tara:strand:- start:7876 stop:9201 length:1326 start_codon:yes stop_codon:yes gene_type:complete